MKTLLNVAAAFVVLLLDWLNSASNTSDGPVRGSIVRFVVKHPWVTTGAIGGVIAIGAALVVVSGVVPIKASSGHWPITARLLDFAKLQSFRTHSWRIEAPPLDDEALVVRGATHYETGCSSCHGRPGVPLPPVMAAMTPPPPELAGERLTRWTSGQLFSIVKHGIKFTGMPAWPAQQRDDEVWAVVAFLRRMPGLDATSYQRLAYGPAPITSGTAAAAQPDPTPSVPSLVRNVCSRCHGIAGTGRGPAAFPSLAGQRAGYMHVALRAFTSRTRHSGIMAPIAATLSDAAMREVTMYFERLPPRAADTGLDSSAIARGAAIANRGAPERDIPACVECHGPTELPKNPAYPVLAGQHAGYLRQQLRLLKERRRGGSPQVTLMYAFVDRLTAGQIDDVTLYYASLSARSLGVARAMAAVTR